LVGGMKLHKKLLFALITVVIVLGTIEGLAQVVWLWLESRALARTVRRGEAVLRNDAINFVKIAHRRYGYMLRPGVSRGGLVVNDQGFAQREVVELGREAGTLRLIAMGESTTQGHDVDTGNYPVYLRRLLKSRGRGFSQADVVNAGVSGWVSDQAALRAEFELSDYRPDIVLLYLGWNDFQSYDPYGPQSRESYFDAVYGQNHVRNRLGSRAIELLSGVVTAVRGRGIERGAVEHAGTGETAPSEIYRFFLISLDRIVTAYRMSTPRVKIAICTLVGRWPYGTLEEYEEKSNGRTWWMKHHGLTPVQAAAALDRFNALIREYARKRDLIMIDAAKAFDGVDRARLQWDFAHLHAAGYELLAEVMYRGLVEAGAVHGERSSRLEALTAEYARRDL
jgi:lysophospholipase L1-like esterase